MKGKLHAFTVCNDIDLILISFVFVTFSCLFSVPLMEWSFKINNNITYITQKLVVWILSEAAMELQDHSASLFVSHCRWPNSRFRKVS